jgi:RND family efflux transporter MFP subunit
MPAPSRNPVSGRVVYVDRALWQQLAHAATTEDFARAWLALQCSMIPGAGAGVVVCGEPEVGPFRPIARFPDEGPPAAALSQVCQDALESGEPRVLEPRNDGEPLAVAYPLRVDGLCYGVAGLELEASKDSGAALRELQWGSSWLDAWLRREHAREEGQAVERLMAVLDLLAVALAQERFRAAAAALASELATRLDCDRVSIGVLQRGHSEVVALSHSALDDRRMNLLRLIGAAMDEAIDQSSVIRHPASDDGTLVQREHQRLVEESGNGAALTVPLLGANGAFGALLFERPRGTGFDDGEVELCKSIALAVGGLLELKRRNDRSAARKLLDAVAGTTAGLIGPRHIGRKLVTAALLAFTAFAVIATGPYRVSANALVEGAVRRMVTAPIDGYLESVDARPGDAVAAGQLLASFDDRDLRLRRLQLASERGQLLARLQDVTARGQRAEALALSAEVSRSAAELELLDEQLSRTELRAPFDGIVVGGDLSQSLGAPFSRGTPLLEIAPLDAYRVVLEVDEHDVAALAEGQPGTVLLAALPDAPLALAVRRITPIATTAEGRNVFRVEADLAADDPRVRPGMRGVAKVDIEQRRLAWIWTHEIQRWLTLRIWAWTP